MTEQIIDGVDVSKCEFLWKEKLPKKVCNNGNLDCDCNSHQNCIFRQLAKTKKKLQAKEQECEELKFTIKHIGLLDLMNENVKLKQALDEIEEFCKQNHYCLESEYRWFSDEIQEIINKVKE